MKLGTFFDNFGLLADAPNGVQKLREMVLQLAVQGKLVPQNPKDEPASVLLDKIKAEKKRLIKEGKIRTQKSTPDINDEEKPFVLPEGWQWCRLGDSGAIFNGDSLNSRQKTSYSNVTNGLPYIATKHVGYGALQIDYSGKIKIPINEPKFKIAHKNAVLICSEGGSAGRKIGLIDRDICFGNKLLANETFSGIIPKFVFYMYQSSFFSSAFKAKMTGIIGGISITNFLGLVIPLPPSEEQSRIIAKVDELIAICDELEDRKQKASIKCIQINDGSLHKLLTARDSKKFSKHWQRICDNFDLLYRKPENVTKLRQAILQLAVQGKLVPQDPKDEPASVLLENIKTKKIRLVKDGKINKTKPLPPIGSDEMLYTLPKQWIWVRFGEIIDLISGQHIKSADYNSNGVGIGYLTGPSDFTDVHPKITKWTEKPKTIARQNDILLTVKGSGLGKNNIVDVNKVAISRQLMAIRCNDVDYRYVHLFINSKYSYFQSIGVGIAIPGLSRESVLTLVFPLPPFNEQKRIVAKVDELMALYVELEAILAKSQTDCDMLTEAAVAKILVA